jgi:hypothetical protein
VFSEDDEDSILPVSRQGVMMVMTTLLEEVTVGGTSYITRAKYMGSTSYGMSCNGNQFVTKKFRGAVLDRMKLRSLTTSDPSTQQSNK